MQRLFLFMLFFFSASYTMHAQDLFLAEATEKWENAMAYTLELAEAMPAEYYSYRPTEEQMSFQEQLLHMAGNVAWLTHDYLGGPKTDVARDMPDASKKEVIAILKTALERAHQALSGFSPGQLDEEVRFFAGPMSKRKVILLLHDHLTHHRGQAIVYARLNGIKPPRYRGW